MSTLVAEALPAACRGFASLAETIDDLVLVVARDGRIVFLNRAGRAILGLPSPGPLGSPVRQLLADDERGLDLILDGACDARPMIELPLSFQPAAGGQPLAMDCRCFPLETPSGQARDVYAVVGLERGRRLDDTRWDLPEDAPTSTRMMELLTGVVGHDLRNPLHAIVTCAHVVLRQVETPGAQISMKRIITAGHRMQRMIDQLLDLTRLRVGGGIPLRLAPVNLRKVVEQIVQEFRGANPGWTITVTVEGSPEGVWDADRLAQALSNLIGNAVQHGTRSDGIQVAIDAVGEAGIVIAIHSGGTIPADVLPVLFNPFRVIHHGREKARGLGLGLYITRQIAVAHGGDVEVTSDDGGTVFRVRIPRDASARRALPSAEEAFAEEVTALEQLTAIAPPTALTARLFGVAPLHERAPQEYWPLFERYAAVLDRALDRQTYRDLPDTLTDDLRDIADQLGALGAGAREVAELHGRALRQRTRDVTVARAQALTNEGRIVAFELMGHLLSYYRRHAGLSPKP